MGRERGGGGGGLHHFPPITSHSLWPCHYQQGQGAVLWPWHLGHKTLSGIFRFLQYLLMKIWDGDAIFTTRLMSRAGLRGRQRQKRKGDLRTAVRSAEDHHNVGSPDDHAGLKPAITLSKKDWLLRANRALV